MKRLLEKKWIAGLLLIIALGLFGCDNSFVDPFENDGKYYSIYGYLDQQNRTHRVRVMEITRFQQIIESESDPQATIDAEVYLTDLTTGGRTKWEHSLERLEDGTYGHIYTGQHLLTPKRRYRLEVIRSDGVMAVAETRIPAAVQDNISIREDPFQDPASGALVQDITLPHLTSPWNIQVIYYLATQGRAIPVFIPYGRAGSPAEEDGWRFRIHLERDQEVVQQVFESETAGAEVAPSYSISTMGIQLRLLDDENWTPPDGIFDPEVLAQPGVLSNVENGYGFFGGVGLYIEQWSSQGLF